MANTLNFTQIATILNSVNQQATGRSDMVVTNTSDFVSVATTTLLSGYDNVINAISQVLSRTIFSIRPYNRKFSGLFMSEVAFGSHIRKLTAVDSDAQEDTSKTLSANTYDMYRVNKKLVLQTNFYGANVYKRWVTIYRNQLKEAFTGPEQFGSFISMILQNVSDQIEQDHENLARMTVANFIGGKIAANNNVIKLVSEYNDVTGLQLDSDTVKQPENFVPFMKWAWARIKTVSDMMTERSEMFHINVDGKPVSRHTPKERQKMYMYAAEVNNMEASVLSSVFHDNYLRGVEFETVNFWQSIKTPMGIRVAPSYMKEDGTVETAEEEIVQSNVFGVLFDEEAMGITVIDQWTSTTPFNSDGGYSNTFWHFTDRYYNDFTENGVVFLLE